MVQGELEARHRGLLCSRCSLELVADCHGQSPFGLEGPSSETWLRHHDRYTLRVHRARPRTARGLAEAAGGHPTAEQEDRAGEVELGRVVYTAVEQAGHRAAAGRRAGVAVLAAVAVAAVGGGIAAEHSSGDSSGLLEERVGAAEQRVAGPAQDAIAAVGGMAVDEVAGQDMALQAAVRTVSAEGRRGKQEQGPGSRHDPQKVTVHLDLRDHHRGHHAAQVAGNPGRTVDSLQEGPKAVLVEAPVAAAHSCTRPSRPTCRSWLTGQNW